MPQNIFEAGSLNLQALVVSDVYLVIQPPQTPLIPGLPTDGIGIVGTASKGKPNTPIPVSDPQSLVRAFGNINTSAFDLVTEAIGAMKQGASNIWAVRVTDGSDVAASAQVFDGAGTPGPLVTFTAASTGSDANNDRVIVGPGSNNVAVSASGSVTLAGVWAAGETLTISVGGTAVIYTAVTGDTIQTIAVAIAALLNATTAVAALVSSTASGAVVTVTAITKGSAGNAITLATTETAVAGTSTPSGATLANGTGTQTYKVVVTSNTDVAEIFDNIAGIAGTGSTSAAQAIVNAITNGVSGIRGPSAIVTAAISASPGTGTLQNQTVALTGGTSGRTGVSSSTLLGVDGLTRTGMYALRGTPIFQFGLAGTTDPSSWSTQVAFAVSEGLVVVLGHAAFKSATQAVTDKANAAIDDYHAIMVKDWLYLNDTVNSQIRLVSPIGAMLGRLATLSPEQSPGNKPILGYLGTERTGYFSAGGVFVAGVPYARAELGLLEGAGIEFATQPSVGGGFLGFRHGQNASSDPTRNGINYTRMVPFIAKSLEGALGFAVQEVHTPILRARVKSAISEFLSSMANPGPGRTPMIGDSLGGPAYSVVCDATNNPPNLVAQGYLFCSVQVKLLAIIRFFVITVEAGQSVTVKVQQSPIQQAAA